MDTETRQQLSSLVIPLCKGVLYRNQQATLWQTLLDKQTQVLDYVRVLGLDLIIDESEGFAYLHQRVVEQDEESQENKSKPAALPRLIQRRPLSYPVSLLCVLLRKKLIENDASGISTRVILSREQIVELIRVFLPDQANEARIVEQIDTHINKVIELGFLRKLKAENSGDAPAFEIQRIIQALVDADWLAHLDEKLKIYQDYANTGT